MEKCKKPGRKMRPLSGWLLFILVAAFFSVQTVWAASGEGVTYEGFGYGHGGEVRLRVTVQDQKITHIEEVSQKETPAYWEKAKVLFEHIITYQRWDNAIDAISGATESSDAVKEAVDNALKGVVIDRTGTPDPTEEVPVIPVKDTELQPDIVEAPEIDPAKIYDSGSGTAEDPYQIRTENQLRKFALSVTEENDYRGKYVVLTADIDVSDGVWIAAGQGLYSFNGTFDGQGHTVSGLCAGTDEKAMKLQDNVTSYGFFASLQRYAVVKNLTLKDVDLHIAGSGMDAVGGIAGITQREYSETERDGALIDHCRVYGTIDLQADSLNNFAGGLVGMQVRGAVINSMTDVKVSCRVASGSNYAQAGGLVASQALALVANCYALGEVYGSYGAGKGGFPNVGSLIGIMDGDIVNCYGSGKVASEQKTIYAGTLFGQIDEAGKAYHCYYDNNLSLTVAGEATEQKAAGDIFDKNDEEAISEDGRRYIGGVAYDLRGIQADLSVAEELNDHGGAFPVDVTWYGVDVNALDKWSYDGGLILGAGKMPLQYQLCEADIVELDLQDGVFYGRSVDGSTIVKINVKDGRVSESLVVSGEKTGEVYYDALDTAREKSAQGDVSGYGRADAALFAGGSGTVKDPYRISDEQQLRAIAEALNADESFQDVYFLQTADITLSPVDWLPIGWGTLNKDRQSDEHYSQYVFQGHYDGGDHVISGLRIGREGEPALEGVYGSGAGLFGYISGSKIQNIHLEDAAIYVASSKKHTAAAGCLVGQTGSRVSINHCIVKGTVSVQAGGEARGAGLVGYGSNTVTTNSEADADIYVDGDTANGGGLYGTDSSCVTMNCIFKGTVNGGSKARVGGLSGTAAGLMYNCVVSGEAAGSTAGALHGLRIGTSSVDACCYYDSDENRKEVGLDYASNPLQKQAEGKTTADMAKEDFLELLNKNADAVKEAVQDIQNAAGLTVGYIASCYDAGSTPSGNWKLENGILTVESVSNNTDSEKEDNGKTTEATQASSDKKESTGGSKASEESKKQTEKMKTSFKVKGSSYKIISRSRKTAALTKAKNSRAFTVPATVRYQGVDYKVIRVNGKAFTGKKIRSVVLGKNVKTIKAKAFASSRVTSVTLKTKLLTKKSVKKSLQGSKVRTIRVKIGSKKVNKTYVKKYRKIFIKKNVGRKVKVQ